MNRTSLAFGSRQETSNSEMIAVAQLAESLGYDTFFTGESWGRDAFTVLTMLACHTQTLRLGTGIVPVFSRTPALIAQSIASLDQISQGRATLGLGTSGRTVIEDWHGQEYRRPLARTREYIEIIRAALSGEPVNYQSALFQLSRFRLGVSPVQQHLPVYLASIGPKNLELTGELADGWLPIWTHLRHLPEMKESIGQAAARAGRDISQITVAPQILCYATEDAGELAQARQDVRNHIAYYIGGMGTYYSNLFCRYGYQAEVETIRESWANRQRDQASATITDEMVDNITILGDPVSCRAKLDRFRVGGADMPVIAFPHGASTQAIERTLEALAPAKTPIETGPGR